MTAIAEKVAAEHTGWGMTGPDVYGDFDLECFDCGALLAAPSPNDNEGRYTLMYCHLIEVTEAAVRAKIAADLEAEAVGVSNPLRSITFRRAARIAAGGAS